MMKRIPYGHQYIDKSDIDAVVKALKSDWLTQGPKVKEFEDALCAYTGARYGVAVSSGTAALHIACLAAGIGRGDEAVASPMTFVATSNAVLYCGGRPLFVDIRKDTANIDPDEIKKNVSKKTKVIVPVHFAGCPADLDRIYQIARKRGMMVIEDAAHALGAVYKYSKIGDCKYSDMAIFSFHPVKAVTTGEGGAVVTNNKILYKKLLMLRNHGFTKDASMFKNPTPIIRGSGEWYYEMQALGFNYRITDIQCALGISQLKKIDGFIKRRREIAGIYNRAFSRIKDLELPGESKDSRSAWHIYQLRLRSEKTREAMFRYLRKRGIYAQVHYIPPYQHPFYKDIGYKRDACPNAEDFYKKTISIPLYPAMKKSDIDYVIKEVHKFSSTVI